MRSLLLHVTHFYLVLAVLAGVPAGASRAVLCVAPNGHVAIEVGEGRCGDYAATSSGDLENSGVCTTPDGCASCVDLPMGKQVLSSANHGAPSTNASFASLTLDASSAPVADLTRATTRVDVAQVKSSRPAFPPSRTTILRN